ncbi:hypothetical protein INQ20_28555, partial [Escherichia coli]|uniref:hypothetical protein n=1 Tax=Escherichia coli TaxID=562 RepID=UPI0019334E74
HTARSADIPIDREVAVVPDSDVRAKQLMIGGDIGLAELAADPDVASGLGGYRIGDEAWVHDDIAALGIQADIAEHAG